MFRHLSWNEPDLPEALSTAFSESGLSVQDKVVLLGAICSVEQASATAKGGAIAPRVDPDDDADEMFPSDGGVFIPKTFGSQRAMFGDLLTEVLDTAIFFIS